MSITKLSMFGKEHGPRKGRRKCRSSHSTTIHKSAAHVNNTPSVSGPGLRHCGESTHNIVLSVCHLRPLCLFAFVMSEGAPVTMTKLFLIKGCMTQIKIRKIDCGKTNCFMSLAVSYRSIWTHFGVSNTRLAI